MTTKTDIVVKPKLMKIFDLDDFEKLIQGLKVATCMLTEAQQVVDEASVIKRLNALTLNGATDGNCCSCCGVGPFESRSQQTAHYKHHWHTHNLKRKLFGRRPVSFVEFNARQDDNSSVSSSDSESETAKNSHNTASSELFAAATRHCKAFYTNQRRQVFGIYRCILHHRKEDLSLDGNGAAWVDRCTRLTYPGYQRWAIFMVSGGHFAGAIFSGSAAVLHKTFHSYVTRRGQGHSQVNRDQHGNAPKSAGASLRRYNQAQFLEHIQQLVSTWTEDLAGCSLILYRAVGSVNQGAIFGKGSPLKKDDPRLRVLPFPTRKPTYKEVQRAHAILSSVEVYESMELFQKALISTKTLNSTISSSSDTSIASSKKSQKSTNKPIDRAKSRERAPRELPTQVESSEDDGPCYLDLETPAGWTQELMNQKKNGILTNSRKDLLLDSAATSERSDSETESEGRKEQGKKKEEKRKERKKKPDAKKGDKEKKKEDAVKIPANVKKMWKIISGNDLGSLETIFEGWESSELEAACNTRDPVDGNTALHKAAIAAKPDMVTEVLTAGGDPCIRNHAQQTPYAATPHNDTRLAFRLFQAQHPDKYNYAKSHIPGPLTPELIEQEKEKKAQQKRAKRQRDKEKQVEKIKSNKFLQLTDNQKLRSDELRCFVCATPLPKDYFGYDHFKFCTVRCLQLHRNVRPIQMPP